MARMRVVVDANLRERLVAETLVDDFAELWRRSWEDFGFALPGCESSTIAQRRFVAAVTRISLSAGGEVTGISAHGNVIGLFLNSLDREAGRAVAEGLLNPDVVKVVRRDGAFTWDREFRLPGLERIATRHEETPVGEGRRSMTRA